MRKCGSLIGSYTIRPKGLIRSSIRRAGVQTFHDASSSECLRRSVTASLQPQQYRFPENSFIEEVSFVMQTHPEGEEELVVQPYSLKATRQTGFLVDFHFRLGKNVPFSRKIQQLSLSLDRNFRRNVDYYVDRSSKMRSFSNKRWPVLQE